MPKPTKSEADIDSKRNLPDVLELQFDGHQEVVLLLEELAEIQGKIGVKPDEKKGKEGSGWLAQAAIIKQKLSAILAVEGLPGLRHNNLVFSDCWIDGKETTPLKDLKIELALAGFLKTDEDYAKFEECVKAATKKGDGYLRRQLTDLNKPRSGWED